MGHGARHGAHGSGKTNTLYSSIAKIDTQETDIMTAEDPVEFDLAGASTRCRCRRTSVSTSPPPCVRSCGRTRTVKSATQTPTNRREGGAHGPPRALDAQHQDAQPADEHGHRAVCPWRARCTSCALSASCAAYPRRAASARAGSTTCMPVLPGRCRRRDPDAGEALLPDKGRVGLYEVMEVGGTA